MNQKNRSFLLLSLSIALILLLAACQKGLGGESIKVSPPAAGKATVMGRIVSTAGKAYANTPVRLARIYGEGDQKAYVLDLARSPGSFTDEDGNFVIPDVTVDEYSVIVGDPDGAYTVIAEEDGNAKTWAAEAGKVLDLGTIKVRLELQETQP